MRLDADALWLSPTDLATHLECHHATTLAAAAARGDGAAAAPGGDYARLIARKGREHERSYLEKLGADGRGVVLIDVDSGGLEDAATLTELAMRESAEVIYQGAFADGGWRGRADFLERVERPTGLGGWGYEAVDTKLSRAQALPHHVLQLSVYSQAIERIQGRAPEWMHLELGSGRRDTIRVAGVAAYVRRAEAALRRAVDDPVASEPYPCPHCAICGFERQCTARWRAEDHLSAVAGIGRGQVERLGAAGIADARGPRPDDGRRRGRRNPASDPRRAPPPGAAPGAQPRLRDARLGAEGRRGGARARAASRPRARVTCSSTWRATPSGPPSGS